MLAEGSDAPTFTLPGIVDGAPRDVDISDYVGGDILVLVFYPGDFNPACEEDSCDLTELDPLTMQQDVEIFAISPDSVFSHRAFAEEYSLSIPLLADTHGAAMDAYDVRCGKSDQLLAKRAVFVVDQRGVIQYAWETEDMEERPEVDPVREAISDIGGDSTAVGRYRVGHAHYMEGRRAFTSAMNSYEDRDWLISQGDFERAMDEFQESADHFQSAVRFAESGPLRQGFERAQEKATALWQAAEWLSDSANAYASGNGKEADDYRQDAETPLENARDIGEPPEPDDIDLDAAAAAAAAEEGDDAEDLESPTDPNEDGDTSEPGGGPTREPDDEDIDAAVQELEAQNRAAGQDSPETDDDASRGEPPAEQAATGDTASSTGTQNSGRSSGAGPVGVESGDTPEVNEPAGENRSPADAAENVPPVEETDDDEPDSGAGHPTSGEVVSEPAGSRGETADSQQDGSTAADDTGGTTDDADDGTADDADDGTADDVGGTADDADEAEEDEEIELDLTDPNE